MSTWRAKVSGFFRNWRYARYRARAARADIHDQRDADELERARKGVNRFPPSAGGVG